MRAVDGPFRAIIFSFGWTIAESAVTAGQCDVGGETWCPTGSSDHVVRVCQVDNDYLVGVVHILPAAMSVVQSVLFNDDVGI